MTSSPNTNPLFQLLQRLPKSIRWRKRQEIKSAMVAMGKFQHYRQCVLRNGWQFGDTHAKAQYVLIKQLGLSLEFFAVKSAQEQQQEVEQILSKYYS